MSAFTRVRKVVRERLPDPWRIRVRHLLEENPLARRQHPELKVIEAEVRNLTVPWTDFCSGLPTAGLPERVVEIPWVISRYRGERRVLDVGSAYALPIYIRLLNALSVPELHGVDLSDRPVQGIRMTRADVRHMPYPDAFFDLVLCISTLEHVGLDNTRYGLSAPAADDGDVRAMAEFRRVLASDGRILITVPFGRPGTYGWFRQYDRARWAAVVDLAGLRTVEQVVYALGPDGWRLCPDPEEIETAMYAELGAAAGAVACVALSA